MKILVGSCWILYYFIHLFWWKLTEVSYFCSTVCCYLQCNPLILTFYILSTFLYTDRVSNSRIFLWYLYWMISLILPNYISQLSYIDMRMAKLETSFDKNVTVSAFLSMIHITLDRSSWSSSTVNNTLHLSLS